MRYIKSILSVILSLLLLCNISLSSLAGSKNSLSSEESPIASSSAYVESEQMMSQSPNTSFFHVDSQSLKVSQTESDTPISSQSKSEVSSEIPKTEVLSEAVSEPSSSKQSENQTSSEATTESPELESTEKQSTEDLETSKEPSSEDFESSEEASTEDLESSEEISTEDLESSEEVSAEDPESSEEVSTEDLETSEETSIEDLETSESESTEEGSLSEFSLFDFERAANYASITSCQITNGNQITIEASFQEEVPSLDQTLYLFELDSYETSIEKKKPIASIDLPKQAANVSITTDLNYNQSSCRLYSKFVLAVFGTDDRYFPVSNFSYITNPEVLAANQNSFPSSTSKKGLLTNSGMFSDIDELNVQHALVNIELHRLLSDGDMPYTYNGSTYYINSSVLASYDSTLKYMADNNIVTSCVLLANYSPSVPELIHPNASGTSSYYAVNTATKEGIDCVSTIIHFLAERYTRTDKAYGYIANWIVGNEVNNPSSWNNMGDVDFTTYMQNYSRAIRLVSTAVKSRTYLCFPRSLLARNRRRTS